MELVRLDSAIIGHDRPLLGGVHLSIAEGDRLAVLGPNGGGKSTLLRSCLGLLPLLRGNRTLADPPPRMAYVPQAHRSDPSFPLSALEVTLQGRFGRLGVFGRTRAADWRRAREQLDRVGLGDRAQVLFRELSGGQRQRVLLARALCAEPDVLFLDEFTSELDPAGSAALLEQISRLAATKAAVVFVTHEISAAIAHSRSVALVDARRGMFECGASSELLTGNHLSDLYGQPVTIERRGGRATVFVETRSEPT